jgi:hypothetical protein
MIAALKSKSSGFPQKVGVENQENYYRCLQNKSPIIGGEIGPSLGAHSLGGKNAQPGAAPRHSTIEE